MLTAIRPEDLFVTFSFESAALGSRPTVRRHLADLRGAFANSAAFDAALARGNPLIYEVTAVEPASGDGQLHYGLGVLQPGKIGNEYYLTKGHHHAHRSAAEVYVGLKGDGAMVLEDEATGEMRMVPLCARSVVYVPGHTAHRTINTGGEPLVYLGIYPAQAGHDYGTIASRNFSRIVIEQDGRPVLTDRPAFRS